MDLSKDPYADVTVRVVPPVDVATVTLLGEGDAVYYGTENRIRAPAAHSAIGGGRRDARGPGLGAAVVKGLGKKKWVLTLGLFLVGSTIAFITKSTLAEFTMFATLLLGTFGAADVTDKKLNGGKYDSAE